MKSNIRKYEEKETKEIEYETATAACGGLSDPRTNAFQAVGHSGDGDQQS